MMELILQNLGSRIEAYLPKILQIVICLAASCTGVLPHRDVISLFAVKSVKNLRSTLQTLLTRVSYCSWPDWILCIDDNYQMIFALLKNVQVAVRFFLYFSSSSHLIHISFQRMRSTQYSMLQSGLRYVKTVFLLLPKQKYILLRCPESVISWILCSISLTSVYLFRNYFKLKLFFSFITFLFGQLEKMPVEVISPTPLLKLFQVWSKNPR